MRRSIFLAAVFLVFFAGQAMAQEQIPNLEGTWKATSPHLHVKGKGFVGVPGSALWKIEKQQGRVIEGKIEWEDNGKIAVKGHDNFSGVIAKDNKTVYIAGHTEGLRFASIEGPDAMTAYFVVPGGKAPRAGYSELTRMK